MGWIFGVVMCFITGIAGVKVYIEKMEVENIILSIICFVLSAIFIKMYLHSKKKRMAESARKKEKRIQNQDDAEYKKKEGGGSVRKRKGVFIGVTVFAIVVVAVAISLPAAQKIEDEQKETNIARKFKEELSLCGIDDEYDIEHDELLDNAHSAGEKGYRIDCLAAKNIILYENADGSVSQIKYADYVLFENGKAKANIEDYTFTISEISEIQIRSEEIVKSILKSPSSAKFPNYLKWAFSKDENNVSVQGYVDSDNSFGANLRSEFQIIYGKRDMDIKSFIFDGEEMITD